MRKPLTNVYTQDDYTIMGSMVCKANLMMLQISHRYPTAWDGVLDVATGPKFGTLAKDAEDNIQRGEGRKRMRTYQQEDITMNEISDLNYDHQEILREKQHPI